MFRPNANAAPSGYAAPCPHCASSPPIERMLPRNGAPISPISSDLETGLRIMPFVNSSVAHSPSSALTPSSPFSGTTAVSSPHASGNPSYPLGSGNAPYELKETSMVELDGAMLACPSLPGPICMKGKDEETQQSSRPFSFIGSDESTTSNDAVFKIGDLVSAHNGGTL
ncbi:MAG: hypothetical protein ABW189_00430 [Rickettsiales bacterium]